MTQGETGIAPRASSRRFFAVGVLAGFAVNATAAWITWQGLQGDRATLRQTEFQSWIAVAIIVAAVTIGVAIALRTMRELAAGLLLGLVLAGVADLLGLFIDIVTTAS